jgi:hypothetical protein
LEEFDSLKSELTTGTLPIINEKDISRPRISSELILSNILDTDQVPIISFVMD